MSDVKKINGYDLKDEVARSKVNIMIEGYDKVVEDLDVLKEEISAIEDVLDGSINDIYKDRLDALDTTVSNIELVVSNIDKQVETNAKGLKALEDMIGNASIIPPTYVEPTLTVSITPVYLEHNKLETIIVKPTFVQNDAGAVTKMEVLKGDTKVYTLNKLADYSTTLVLTHGTIEDYTVVVTYSNGPIKQNSMGVDSPTGAIQAGCITSSKSITAYAPIYYGAIKGDFIADNLLQMNKKVYTTKNTTQNYTLEEEKSVYAYPASFGKLSTIKDDNNFNYINSYTLYEVTYNEIAYYVYVMTDPVTISNFTQIFS